MSELNDTVTLVTGAGDGLGKSLALRIAGLGGTVVLLGRTVYKLESVYDEIIQAGAPQAAIYPLDLSGASAEDYHQLANAIRDEFGRLDNLIHCAATLGAQTPLQQYPAKDWFDTLQANLSGPFFLTQSCLSLLEKSQNASITFTLDRKSSAYWGVYGISKSAVETMMQILADEQEYKRNQDDQRRISINAVMPGPMRTHIRRRAYPGENVQSVMEPDAYVDAYLDLLLPGAKKPNGKVITCD
ncbi:MAG: SDR family NAD(P)-dependent oxidoreductase [Pseudomonadota bacterium]